MKKQDDGAPVAVGKAYDFVLWLLPKVENFPRAYRFTIGERLTTHGLDLLSALLDIETAWRPARNSGTIRRSACGLKIALH
ncbi:MAG: hypothetical protein JJE04_01125 [Acidobacteriia bacterium]|nr:hypothetical protein [Terriglobia bacterium]